MSKPRPLGRSVTIDRAAQLLQKSRRTVYYWIANGKLATVKTISGGSQRVLLDSIAFHQQAQEGRGPWSADSSSGS